MGFKVSIRQGIVALAGASIGTYFNQNIIRCHKLRAGMPAYVSLISSRKFRIELQPKRKTLTISQTVAKLSKDRLGMIIHRDIARALQLKAGMGLLISSPDDNTMVVEVEQ